MTIRDIGTSILAVVACTLWAIPLRADMVYPTWEHGHFSGHGGEFTARPYAWSADPLPYYADSSKNVAKATGAFQTFRLEEQEWAGLFAGSHSD